jgi:hypothetical protein
MGLGATYALKRAVLASKIGPWVAPTFTDATAAATRAPRNEAQGLRVQVDVAWFVVVVGVALFAVWAAKRLRGATVYFSHSLGFTAYRFGSEEDDIRPVPRDRYERILRRFAQGDLFDTLWVSLRHDPNGGVVLSLEEDETQMDVSFRSLKEPERLAAFREGMARNGHLPAEENPWNVGLGVDSESVTLEYRLPTDYEGLSEAVDRALSLLQEPEGNAMFVHAWRSQDGPHGVGIKVQPRRDVLAEVP